MTRSKNNQEVAGGVAHKMPDDLRDALLASRPALAAWEDITTLARNEWICWTISVAKPETRLDHVSRVISELKEGMRRPCCWMGCPHRTDKQLSSAQKIVLANRSKKG